MTTAFKRGDVIWHPAPYKDDPDAGRPFVVLSDDSHPFYGVEYVVAALTTVSRPEALQLTEVDWIRGGTPRDSYVSPWYVMALKHANFKTGIGTLRESIVDRVSREVSSDLGLN